jgi:hypothetical protein
MQLELWWGLCSIRKAPPDVSPRARWLQGSAHLLTSLSSYNTRLLSVILIEFLHLPRTKEAPREYLLGVLRRKACGDRHQQPGHENMAVLWGVLGGPQSIWQTDKTRSCRSAAIRSATRGRHEDTICPTKGFASMNDEHDAMGLDERAADITTNGFEFCKRRRQLQRRKRVNSEFRGSTTPR